MAEIRNLTRNGETFYPLTCTDAVVDRDGNPLEIVNDIFDISEYNASGTPPTLAKYSTLALALAAVPQSKQKGGMTIRYVQTSDNKYVQYRLLSETWSTNRSAWQGVNETLIYRGNLSNTSDDLNTIRYASIYSVTNQNVQNYPLSDSGIIITIPAYTQVLEGKYTFVKQQAISLVDKNKYERFLQGGTWREWEKVNIDESAIITFKGQAQPTDNLDNFESNTIITVIGGQNLPQNYPFSDAGQIITLAVLDYSSTYKTQIAISYSTYDSRIRYQVNGNWTDWQYINKNIKGNELWVFGDSTVYGTTSDGRGQSPYNFPAMAAKITGATLVNMAVSGQGLIKNWTDINTTINNANMSNAKIILVAWSWNDEQLYSSLNFGSYTDEPVGSPNTYIGYFQDIMRKIQVKCPNAQIVLVTGFGYNDPVDGHATFATQWTHNYTFADDSHTIKELYDELEKMAVYNGWSCINQAKGTCINKYNCTSLIADAIHPTYEGYRIYGNFLAGKIAAIWANVC